MTNPQADARGDLFWALAVVKLRRDRVQDLISAKVGLPFMPNGRVFREWVAVPVADEAQWRALLTEAKALVAD